MTGGKMMAAKKQVVCTFYNSGYCRYKGDCKYNHPKENCQESYCKNKMCTKRHPKECRYGHKCRRRSFCLYKHDNSSTPSSNSKSPVVEETEVKKLKVEVEELKVENKEKLEGLKKLANEIENIKKKVDDKDDKITRMLKDKKSLEDEVKALKSFIESLQLENSSNKAKILVLEKDLNNVKESVESKNVNVKEKPMEKSKDNSEDKKQNSTTSKKLDEKVVEPGNTRFDWTPAMKEFRKCRRCGKEFDETNDMIFHMKKEHVNFVKSVQNGLQTMASKRKNPKTHDQQRDCEYFEALAVQLNTADVC